MDKKECQKARIKGKMNYILKEHVIPYGVGGFILIFAIEIMLLSRFYTHYQMLKLFVAGIIFFVLAAFAYGYYKSIVNESLFLGKTDRSKLNDFMMKIKNEKLIKILNIILPVIFFGIVVLIIYITNTLPKKRELLSLYVAYTRAIAMFICCLLLFLTNKKEWIAVGVILFSLSYIFPEGILIVDSVFSGFK